MRSGDDIGMAFAVHELQDPRHAHREHGGSPPRYDAALRLYVNNGAGALRARRNDAQTVWSDILAAALSVEGGVARHHSVQRSNIVPRNRKQVPDLIGETTSRPPQLFDANPW